MKKRSKSWSFSRFFIRVFVIFLILAVSSVLYLSTYGFPSWLLAGILNRVDTGSFSFEPSKLKLDLSGGLMFSDTSIHRKGAIGPAVVRAEEVNIMIDPFRMFAGEPMLSSIRIKNGVVCTPMACDPDADRILITDLDLSCSLLMEDCVVDGIAADSVGADIVCSGSNIRLHDMLIKLATGDESGTVRGYIAYDDRTREATGHLESNFDPHYIVPYIQCVGWKFLAVLIERFEFDQLPPRCNLDFKKLLDESGDFYLKGRCWLPECSYRDVDVLRADGTVEIEVSKDNKYVKVDPLFIVREEGHARGGFNVDVNTGNITFNGVSSVRPIEVMQMVGVYRDSFMGNWHFDGPVSVDARGMINFKDISQRQMDLTFDGRGAGIADCISEQCSFNMNLVNRNVLLTNIVGRIYGGDFKGAVGFVLPDENNPATLYTIEGSVDGSNAYKLITSLGNKRVSKIEGKLSAQGKVSGEFGEHFAEKATGEGVISVRGQVFALPVFGGLTKMMRDLIPGLNFVLGQSDSKAEIVLGDGKIDVKKLKVEGDVLSLNGKGILGFDRELDFDIKVNLMKAHTAGGKLMRVITYPISKLFEFKVKGKLDDPKWYPVNFSSDLLDKIGLKKALGKQE